MPSSTDFLKEFGDELYSPSTSSNVSVEDLAGKTLMVYFAAHWCPSSRSFTPTLVEFYNHMKEKDDKVEVIFVSFDQTEEEYNDYVNEMPWLCTPFNFSEAEKDSLEKRYNVDPENTPELVVMSSTGEVLNPDAIGEVVEDPDGDEFPWKLHSFSEFMPEEVLSKKKLSTLDEKYLMVYFSALWCPAGKAFTPVLVDAYKELKTKRDDFEILFLSSDEDEVSFDAHYKDMPWLAVPYGHRDVPQGMSQLFDVDGLPRLVMLGPVPEEGGERPVINTQIRSFVTEGRLGEFPFHPSPCKNLATDFDGIERTKCLVVFHEHGEEDEQKKTVQTVGEVAKKMIEDESCDVEFYYAITSGDIVSDIKTAIKRENHKESPLMALLDFSDQGAYHVADETDVTEETIMNFVQSPGERQFISMGDDDDEDLIVKGHDM